MKKAPIHGAFCVLLKTSDENKNLVVPLTDLNFPVVKGFQKMYFKNVLSHVL